MKVLLVSEDVPAQKLGGLGKHAVLLGNALLRCGHEVSLLGQATPEYDDCVHEVGFNGTFIPGLSATIGGWKEVALGFFNPLKRPFFARRMAKEIVRYASDFDVVHYHGHHPMVAKYIPASINFIQTRHDQGGDCIINVRFKNGSVCSSRESSACAECVRPGAGVVRTMLSTAAVNVYRKNTISAYNRHPVIFVSKFLRSNYLKTMTGVHLPNSHVIHNFVDEHLLAFHSANTEANTNDDVCVHIAARLDQPKGVGELLGLLKLRLPARWRINIFGDGPLFAELAAEYASSSIHFRGYKPYTDILKATSESSVVVVPSVWQESCGTTIIEALRLGKTCYALSRGGTPELARYGSPGQLRLFDNLPTLVEGLLREKSFHDFPGGESADVAPRLKELVAIYEGGLLRT